MDLAKSTWGGAPVQSSLVYSKQTTSLSRLAPSLPPACSNHHPPRDLDIHSRCSPPSLLFSQKPWLPSLLPGTRNPPSIHPSIHPHSSTTSDTLAIAGLPSTQLNVTGDTEQIRKTSPVNKHNYPLATLTRAFSHA